MNLFELETLGGMHGASQVSPIKIGRVDAMHSNH